MSGNVSKKELKKAMRDNDTALESMKVDIKIIKNQVALLRDDSKSFWPSNKDWTCIFIGIIVAFSVTVILWGSLPKKA